MIDDEAAFINNLKVSETQHWKVWQNWQGHIDITEAAHQTSLIKTPHGTINVVSFEKADIFCLNYWSIKVSKSYWPLL